MGHGADKALRKHTFLGRFTWVNRMYFCQEWDALKSVKYVSASHVNQSRAIRSRGGASTL